MVLGLVLTNFQCLAYRVSGLQEIVGRNKGIVLAERTQNRGQCVALLAGGCPTGCRNRPTSSTS